MHSQRETNTHTQAYFKRFVSTARDWLGQSDPLSLLRHAKLNNSRDNRVLIAAAREQELWVSNANSGNRRAQMAVFLKTCPEADTALEHRAGCRRKETGRMCRREEERGRWGGGDKVVLASSLIYMCLCLCLCLCMHACLRAQIEWWVTGMSTRCASSIFLITQGPQPVYIWDKTHLHVQLYTHWFSLIDFAILSSRAQREYVSLCGQVNV